MATPILKPIPVYEYSPDASSGGGTPDRFLYSDLPTVESGWKLNGIAFHAFDKNHPSVIPVFRYDAVNPQRFQYRTDPVPALGSGWVKGGTAFYAFMTPQANTVPVHRYSATNPQRFRYSTNSKLEDAVWTDEGEAFYVSK